MISESPRKVTKAAGGTPERQRRDIITVRIPDKDLRGATTPLDRTIMDPSQIKDYVRRLRTEMKGRRDFSEGALHWTDQARVLREGYERGDFKPAEYDQIVGALIAEKEYYGEIDVLTETYNRRAFLQRAKEVFSAAEREGTTVSLAILDLDRFKPINDTYGHDTGDAVLQQAAGVLQSDKRTEDVLARWGGEEFVLLLPKTTKEEAAILIQRIVQGMPEAVEEALSEMGIRIDQSVTVSVGLVDTNHTTDPDDLFKAADSALYAAKSLGRNRAASLTREPDESLSFTDLTSGDKYKERTEIVDNQEVRHYDKIEE